MTRTLALSFATASLLAAGAASAATTIKTVTRTAVGDRVVTTKTKTGKTVTYNCSKPGNAHKLACRQ